MLEFMIGNIVLLLLNPQTYSQTTKKKCNEYDNPYTQNLSRTARIPLFVQTLSSVQCVLLKALEVNLIIHPLGCFVIDLCIIVSWLEWKSWDVLVNRIAQKRKMKSTCGGVENINMQLKSSMFYKNVKVDRKPCT